VRPNIKLAAMFGLCAAAAASPASAANLLINGSFEMNPTSVVWYTAPSTAITGFTVVNLPGGNNVVQLTNNSAYGGLGVVASDGKQFLDLTGVVGRGAGVRSDNFATVAGAKYAVSFDVGAFNVGGSSYGDAIVDLYVSGQFAGSYLNTMSLNRAGSDYQRFTYQFTGTGTPMNIALYSSLSPASSNLGVGLDNLEVVRVANGVPEPASWALMLGGLGLVGASLRRRATAVTV